MDVHGPYRKELAGVKDGEVFGVVPAQNVSVVFEEHAVVYLRQVVVAIGVVGAAVVVAGNGAEAVERLGPGV